MKIITKQDLIQELYGILAMCDGFSELTHAGGTRQIEMQKHLPHQIACRIMELQSKLEQNMLGGDIKTEGCSCIENEKCSNCV